MFLITSAEGKLQLVGKGGRLEKPVDEYLWDALSP